MKTDLAPTVITFEYTKVLGAENIDFGKYIIIDDFVLIYAKDRIKFGNYIHIGSFTSITVSGGGNLTVGDFVAISHGCRVLTSSDDFKHWGFGHSSIDNQFRNIKSGDINIGNFCMIGVNSVILPGVTIGEGAAVGAGSVVTKDLEPWGIYVGTKKIGERDRDGVLRNYEKFLKTPEEERIGALFKRIK